MEKKLKKDKLPTIKTGFRWQAKELNPSRGTEKSYEPIDAAEEGICEEPQENGKSGECERKKKLG